MGGRDAVRKLSVYSLKSESHRIIFYNDTLYNDDLLVGFNIDMKTV